MTPWTVWYTWRSSVDLLLTHGTCLTGGLWESADVAFVSCSWRAHRARWCEGQGGPLRWVFCIAGPAPAAVVVRQLYDLSVNEKLRHWWWPTHRVLVFGHAVWVECLQDYVTWKAYQMVICFFKTCFWVNVFFFISVCKGCHKGQTSEILYTLQWLE